jgi:hypothetical protein
MEKKNEINKDLCRKKVSELFSFFDGVTYKEVLWIIGQFLFRTICIFEDEGDTNVRSFTKKILSYMIEDFDKPVVEIKIEG